MPQATGSSPDFRNKGKQAHNRIEPLSIVLVLVLASITMLFIGLSVAMLYTVFDSSIEAPFPPKIFFATIVLLVAATFFIRRAKHTYTTGRQYAAMKNLVLCLILTICFGIVQSVGWVQFFNEGYSIEGQTISRYTFALSVLHLLHVVAGIPFLLLFIIRVRAANRDMTSFPPPKHINALALYWDFIDVLWIALVALLATIALLT